MIRVPVVAAALVAAVALSAPAQAPAPVPKLQGVREAATDIAKEVATVARAQGLAGVRVGKFTGNDFQSGTTGPLVEAEVAFALEQLKLLDPKSMSEVSGDYGLKADALNPGSKVGEVKAKFQVGMGAQNVALPAIEVRLNTDLAHMLGVSGAIGRGQFPARNLEILQLHAAPAATLRPMSASVLMPSAKSDFTVEVRARPANAGPGGAAVPCPAAVVKGLPSVRTAPGDTFELRIQNHSAAEIAVAVATDGIDVLAGNPNKGPNGRAAVTHFLVPPAVNGQPGLIIIPGPLEAGANGGAAWGTFRIPAGNGAAGRPGTIHVAFSPVWALGAVQLQPPPTLTGVRPAGQVLDLATDVPTEFLTIQYQR